MISVVSLLCFTSLFIDVFALNRPVIHEFSMTKTCEGCLVNVYAVLSDIGVDNGDINIAKNTIQVRTNVPVETLIKALEKTGKMVQYIGVKEEKSTTR
ncbi:Cytosolic copper metallochaperone [Mactra antiquata]